LKKFKKNKSKPNLESDLVFIYTNYWFIVTVITCLETKGTLLTDLNCRECKNKLNTVKCYRGIYKNLNKLLRRN